VKLPLLLAAVTLSAFAADAPIPTPETVVKTYTKKLTRLTDKPKSISAELAGMCTTIPADKKFGPHSRHFVHQYRNELAMAAKGNFPPGSVLVKEKLSPIEKDGGQLAVVYATGMIKQPAGTSPKSGDWLFFEIVEGKAETAKMEGCAGCHSGAKRDHVFTDVPKR
jgi:hypothetical protein